MYYLLLDGIQSGPFNLAQIIEMWQARRVDALTLYWEEGNADWLPLHNIAPLLQASAHAAGAAPPPPLPASPRPVFPSAPVSAAPTAAGGEQTVWSGHPSLWNWAGELFWGLLFSLVLVGIPFVVHVFWARKTTRFEVTRHRVSVETGLFTRSSRELRIADIRSITARSNIFGIGQLEFSTAARDEADVVFWGVKRVEHVRDLVKQLQNR
jgi:membrane protein YdbS with pleckstrin-like domain